MRHLLPCLGLALMAPLSHGASPPPAALEHFEKHVRPVLVEKCVSCHGPKTARGGLRLDTRAGLAKGGDSGAAFVAGEPDKSLLIKAVRQEGELKMPPKGKPALDRGAIEHLAAWVRAGAPWPEEKGGKPALSDVALARKTHWSFRPVTRPAVPAVKGADWAQTPVDRFILARLEAKGLTAAPEADRRTLIRRLSFDLLGLPPAPEEVEAFVADRRPDAYERLVDRLLASPAYGERWGRHWLDVARYADTKGYVFLEERRYPYSYTYRDYVVGALNEDLPYDQFILHQLAADQLPLGEDRRPLAAMGYLTLGRRFLNNIHDIIDDRIDVVTRGLMGLTVGCARCHDHKYDPIPSRDYYSLHGVFASSLEPRELPLLAGPDRTKGISAFQKELAVRQAAVDRYLAEQHGVTLGRLRDRAADYLLATVREGPRLRGGDLNRAAVARWRQSLAQARKGHHPVLAPWFAFAALDGKDFAEKAPALSARVAANGDEKKRVNPVVSKAFAGKAPASLAEVAKRYEALFQEADRRWQAEQQEARKAGRPAPARLADADLEAVRQALYGPGAPLGVAVADLAPLLDRAQRNRLTALKVRVDQWNATGAGAPARAMVLVDAPSPVNPRVLVRGNPANPGVEVPRQFLEVLTEGARRPFTKGSGRLELARAIASRDNPLTARVMANRLWMHHFGQALVRTPADFGTRGDAPTHPELLDWLASELVDGGWSLKRLHRAVLLSAAYRQASGDRDGPLAVDPENTLVWRMNRKRLELEPLRDAMLAVSGRLDARMGGAAVDITKAPYPPRRSIYGFIDRQNLPGLFRTFDLASPDSSTAQRHRTTVPQQALFLMNGPFVQGLARGMMERSDVAGAGSDDARIDRMYRLAYGRPADAEEVALARAFVSGPASEGGLSAWEQYAQVLLLANEFAFVD